MSESNTDTSVERFCAGNPFSYAMRGVDEIPGTAKSSNESLAGPIGETYGVSVSGDTADVLERLNNSTEPDQLVSAIKKTGLNEVDDWTGMFDKEELNESVDDVDDPGLGEAMRMLDTMLSDAHCSREKDAAKITTKRERSHLYVPEVINNTDGGDVFMAKTLSSPTKVRIAWDLNDSNEVVVVDDYDKWEQLLGWRKLKELPHGKNKIREELGDQLSDDVLEVVTGDDADSDDDDDTDDSGPSRGRRTRTKPSEEVLNIARGSRHRQRKKMKSKEIAETFADDETIGYHEISMLVLFPSTCDLNMTDHWWVAGDRWPNGGAVAIANCNKGTFEYLNQYEQVWHIEDYIDQAPHHEFQTQDGALTMNAASTDNLVLHIVSEKTKGRLLADEIIDDIPGALVEYAENEMSSYRKPELPHPDDMVYAPITREDAFWMRPELRKQQTPSDGDAVVCYSDAGSRNLGNTYNISSDYRLYSRARLSDWDFDSTELEQLDKASHYMKLDSGGYEVLETLGKLHDRGEKPFSETPEARWK